MKKKYVKPKLETHGKLETITKGGGLAGEDEDLRMDS